MTEKQQSQQNRSSRASETRSTQERKKLWRPASSLDAPQPSDLQFDPESIQFLPLQLPQALLPTLTHRHQ